MFTPDPGLLEVMDHFGVTAADLLGGGGEACVFALDGGRVLRVHHADTDAMTVDARLALLAELARDATRVPFAIPCVLERTEARQRIVTIEARRPGEPLTRLLERETGAARDALIVALLEAASQLRSLRVARPWFGDLCERQPVRAPSWPAYLERRAAQSLAVAGQGFAHVDPSALALALSHPLSLGSHAALDATGPDESAPRLVHLDLYGGNVLYDGGRVSAVIDFGGVPIVGDARLDPLSAAAYLTPAITRAATPRDQQVARAWLDAHGLAPLLEPVTRWLAARWSFARDDRVLHAWCRQVLLGERALV